MVYRSIGGVAIALFVVGAGLIYWKGRPEAQSKPTNHSSTADIAALRAEVSELKRNSAASLVFAAHAAQDRALDQNTPVGSAREPSPLPPAKEESELEKAEAARRSELEMAESLDRKFAAEPVDREWSAGAADEARRALLSEIAGDTSLRRVECRATWCRFETYHESVEAFKTFSQKSLLDRERQLWNGGFSSSVRDESESGVTAVTFFTREGHDMPLPDGVVPSTPQAQAPR